MKSPRALLNVAITLVLIAFIVTNLYNLAHYFITGH